MADGISVWIPVITALAGIGGALGSQYISHRFTLNREKKASEDKMQRERYFIATGLVFLLERFAQRCVYSAYESGFNEPEHGYFCVNHTLPEFSYDGIDGDWRSLPPELMFRLSQMPVLQQEALQSIQSAFGNDDPYDGSDGLSEINKQSSRLGLRAIRLSRELRQICSMPHDDLSAHHWSAWRMLSIARARSINAELCYARSNHKYHASLRLMESVNSLSTRLPDKE
ncbi:MULTISPECIES: hypothetical protein [Klebsiella]|uniref:hypothetical protein n=1 Tax=Klebsiella TaxID=570 RepID=UPI00192D9C34|nr:hypothetical protein [Klebsiella pneumoniae]MBL6258677.1 hypothetical protein [Klebsiella pneumoniae]MEC5525746.1 hypothetical protein [Klebsiella pneumoniae]MEC5563135.1 hypothetical protein [Klebsiella pneumoniae]HDK6063971.1 hypothetical protein [Klebsiella pneumoniae]